MQDKFTLQKKMTLKYLCACLPSYFLDNRKHEMKPHKDNIDFIQKNSTVTIQEKHFPFLSAYIEAVIFSLVKSQM